MSKCCGLKKNVKWEGNNGSCHKWHSWNSSYKESVKVIKRTGHPWKYKNLLGDNIIRIGHNTTENGEVLKIFIVN